MAGRVTTCEGQGTSLSCKPWAASHPLAGPRCGCSLGHFPCALCFSESIMCSAGFVCRQENRPKAMAFSSSCQNILRNKKLKMAKVVSSYLITTLFFAGQGILWAGRLGGAAIRWRLGLVNALGKNGANRGFSPLGHHPLLSVWWNFLESSPQGRCVPSSLKMVPQPVEENLCSPFPPR